MSKTKRFSHLISLDCPCCYQSGMFLSNPYNLGKLGKMPKHCPTCGTDFEPEPGFYFGALIISYALAAPTLLIMFFLFSNVLDLSFELSLGSLVIGMLLIAPYLMHLSRSIYLYFHVNSNPEAGKGS